MKGRKQLSPRARRLRWFAWRLGPAPFLVGIGLVNLAWGHWSTALADILWGVSLVFYTTSSVYLWRAGFWRGQAELSRLMSRVRGPEDQVMLRLHFERTASPWDPDLELTDDDERPG